MITKNVPKIFLFVLFVERSKDFAMEVEDHPCYHRNKARCLLHIFKTKGVHKFSSHKISKD